MTTKPKLKLPLTVLRRLEKQLSVRIPKHLNPFIEIADLLNLSKESIYRRFRGETPFTLDEIWQITQTYNFSLDEFASTMDSLNGAFRLIDSSVNSLKDVVNQLQVKIEKSLNNENANLYVLAADIPVIRLLNYPSLYQLKWFHWEATSITNKGNTIAIESYESVGQFVKNKTYQRYQPVEFWPATILSTTLNQISYYHQCNTLTNTNLIFKLFKELMLLVHEAIFNQDGLNMILYQYELTLENVAYLIDCGPEAFVAITLGNSSIIYSESKSLITQYQGILEHVINHSIKLTNQSLRNKVTFETVLFAKIFKCADSILEPVKLKELKEIQF